MCPFLTETIKIIASPHFLYQPQSVGTMPSTILFEILQNARYIYGYQIFREAKTRVIVKRFLNRECSTYCLGKRKSNSVKGIPDKSAWNTGSQNEL